MKDELLRELTDELASGTAASAIAVCRDRAPEIARAIGERQGVTLGRTSWKLRNPENGGPDWTESLLADRRDPVRAYGESYGTMFWHGWSPLVCLRDDRWTYIDAPRPELYDRWSDPGEEHDVVGAHR